MLGDKAMVEEVVLVMALEVMCKKIRHTVLCCRERFDRNFTGDDKMAKSAEGLGYNVDTFLVEIFMGM
jgi:hypothetical protein